LRVIVDTPVWSLALRRARGALSRPQFEIVEEWSRLVQGDAVVLIGVVRQELLSGIRNRGVFERLRGQLRAFEDVPLDIEDFEEGARCANRCRAAGIAGSLVDYLICAAARRRGYAIFTLDADFERYARVLSLRLHSWTGAQS